MIIRIGTRGSALALKQTNWVAAQLRDYSPGIETQICIIKTQGDLLQDVALAKIGDKGLFVKEIEKALLAEEVDLAVHSMKDLPTDLPPDLCIAAVPLREDPRDALISREGFPLDKLRLKARIGSSSLRRQAQLKHYRPDFQIENLRGNLDTRLRKLKEGLFDATLLASAGLVRMGWDQEITERLPFSICLPAVGQGALAIETRLESPEVRKIVASLNDERTHTCVNAERSLMRTLQGGCQIPIGAIAQETPQGTLSLQAMIASLDGQKLVRDEITGPPQEAEELGHRLAEYLLDKGGREILAELR